MLPTLSWPGLPVSGDTVGLIVQFWGKTSVAWVSEFTREFRPQGRENKLSLLEEHPWPGLEVEREPTSGPGHTMSSGRRETTSGNRCIWGFSLS